MSLTVRPAPGDVDSDNDADQGDFGHLQASLTGPAGGPAPACADADLNQDNRVDGVDLNLFLGCMNGPGEAIDPNCVP